MIIGSDKVIEWLRTNETPYWRILNTEKGGVIFEGLNSKEELTLNDSVTRLEQALAMLSAGTYYMDAWDKFKASNNDRFKTRFVITGNENQNSPGGIGNFQGMVPQASIQEQIKKALDDYKRDQENERLRTEVNQLNEEINNTFYRVVKRLEPVLGLAGVAIEDLYPEMKQIRITGPNQDLKSDEMNIQDQQRLENAFESWGKKDSDCITLVEKIARLAESDPATYAMAKKILMSK